MSEVERRRDARVPLTVARAAHHQGCDHRIRAKLIPPLVAYIFDGLPFSRWGEGLGILRDGRLPLWTFGDRLLPSGDTEVTVAAMVQAQSLRGYRELVGDLGGNPTRLLRQAGIDPVALSRLTAFISFEELTDLMERSAAELRCPDFGLRLAERQDIGILGTLAVAMRYSVTVGEAMQCVSKYLEVYNAAIAFTIRTGEPRNKARLEFRLLPEHSLPWAQTAEHGIGLTWRIMTLLSEGRCHLHQASFPHAAVATEANYRARFNAPLVFRAHQAALIVAETDLELPISENIQELRDVATRYLDRQVSGGSTTLTVQVRQAIEALLGTGSCSHGEVARALHMHPRTLQRRMRKEGNTFEAVKDQARRDLGQRYLSQPDLSFTQISVLLGYSEQSAFGRSCRRWFDMTPREARAHLSSPVPTTNMRSQD
jgi:AraC-like DNA-binding protein